MYIKIINIGGTYLDISPTCEQTFDISNKCHSSISIYSSFYYLIFLFFCCSEKRPEKILRFFQFSLSTSFTSASSLAIWTFWALVPKFFLGELIWIWYLCVCVCVCFVYLSSQSPNFVSFSLTYFLSKRVEEIHMQSGNRGSVFIDWSLISNATQTLLTRFFSFLFNRKNTNFIHVSANYCYLFCIHFAREMKFSVSTSYYSRSARINWTKKTNQPTTTTKNEF